MMMVMNDDNYRNHHKIRDVWVCGGVGWGGVERFGAVAKATVG